MVSWLQETGEVYQGQFGNFTVDRNDRLGVVIYRAGLIVASAAVLASAAIATWGLSMTNAFLWLHGLLLLFCFALGVSLFTIHIYLKPLHQLLKSLWAVGSISTLVIPVMTHQSLIESLYPIYAVPLIAVGTVFVALTGLFVKEAFCFNQLESKALAMIIPMLLLGHWLGWMPEAIQLEFLWVWAIVFSEFAIRKAFQAIPPDIGDKTVFAYLYQQRQSQAN